MLNSIELLFYYWLHYIVYTTFLEKTSFGCTFEGKVSLNIIDIPYTISKLNIVLIQHQVQINDVINVWNPFKM